MLQDFGTRLHPLTQKPSNVNNKNFKLTEHNLVNQNNYMHAIS